jgi:predicted phage terminase large subunit-like protein
MQPTSVTKLIDLVKLWKPLVVVTESGTIKNSLEPFIKEQMNARNEYFVLETFPAKHDKVTRAQSAQGFMSVRGLWVPARSDWVEAFKKECLEFPNSAFDDQVDVLSAFAMLRNRLVSGSAPTPKQPNKILSTDPALCQVTLTDLFEANERRGSKHSSGRIR